MDNINFRAATAHGGLATSNQFGTFANHPPSDKQKAFIARLAAERNMEVDPAWILTKKGASRAIDLLVAVPKQGDAPSYTATDKQKTFIRKLLEERSGNPAAEEVRDLLNEARESGSLTSLLASKAINDLLEIPKTEIEAGVYVLPEGNLVRVYFGQQSGHMLAKVVVDGELEYRGKAERVLAPGSRKATVEEVGAWGRSTGTCLVCGRQLDDPESVDRGIGPVCYGKIS